MTLQECQSLCAHREPRYDSQCDARTLLRLCVCMPSLAAAQDDAFKQGLQARSDKKWTDVVRHMQNALKADAQESTRKVGSRLGVGGTEYLPHFFLGEAYFNQQDCGGAVTEWSISEQQGAIKIKPEFLGSSIRISSVRGEGRAAGRGLQPALSIDEQGLRRCHSARQADLRYRHHESRRLASGGG